ncbi:MAG TPA: serine/threonine-protein kinase [Pirellulaceae bacterium]|nr:serine/threonine-protein kinase [Pirellulaceae bacterium]
MTTLHVPLDASTHHWDELARRIEAFLSAWEAGPPLLGEHLPAEPAELRRLTLVELIKVDLEQRHCRKLPRRIDEYMAEFPELLEGGEPPVDLIYEELHVRRCCGDDFPVQEYYERYPGCKQALAKLLGDGLAASSALFAGWKTERHGKGDPANLAAEKNAPRAIGQFAAGQEVEDFELLVELGRGAFAQVFLARQRSMQRLVALKVSAERGEEPQMLATLDHPHIVRVYDQKHLREQRLRLLYMQYVPGGTLGDVIASARQAPPSARSGAQLLASVDAAMQKTGQVVDEHAAWRKRVAAASWAETVCRIGLALARAIDHAHHQGILHRDIKPANVLLAADGSPKLADFNISFGSHVAGATPAAYFGGSLAYMSPEQLEACDPKHPRKAEELDGRSDIFSLAVMLWELLYGFRPFADAGLEGGWNDTLRSMAHRRREAEIAPPPDPIDGDPLARRIEQVLRKALSPLPEERHQTGLALARELALCLDEGSWELFHEFSGFWRRAARARPMLMLVAVNFLPHAAAGFYNYKFNQATVIASAVTDVKERFDLVAWIVNGIAFPLGVLAGLWFAWPVLTAVMRTRRGQKRPADELAAARKRGLSLGGIIAAVGVSEWLIAGIIFPLLLHAASGWKLTGHDFGHFFLSLAVCGLIAAAFPYLGTTWLVTGVFYPLLLGGGAPDGTEPKQLQAIPQQAARYLFLAAVVPLLGVGLVLLTDVDDARRWSGILIAASVAGLVAAYFTYQRICRDVAALSMATRPVETLGTTSESFEI